jgi:hypothetical protein
MLRGDVHVVAILIPTVRLYEAANILQMLSNVGNLCGGFWAIAEGTPTLGFENFMMASSSRW